MQFSTSEALAESELGEFRSLQLSLNAPVIAIDELPVGPARAGVVSCLAPGGGLHLQIAIRSLRSAEVVEIASRLDAHASAKEAAAVEAALSYAEGMGFLFDEDEIAAGTAEARAKAKALWSDLVEGAPERSRRREAETRDEAALEAVDAGADSATDARAEAPTVEVPVRSQHSPVRSIAVDHGPIAERGGADEAAGVLSKFRVSVTVVGPAPDVADVVAAPAAPTGEARIRVLSRY